jgi:4-amino-4-deoxy-L-arabinose transferase-like glycosyltransferase
MPDSPVNTSARKRRYAISGLGLLCGIGVFLLMSLEGQVPHATVYGSVLLLGFVFGLFSMLNLLEPPVGAVALRDTSWAPLPGEPRWAAPQRTVVVALIVLSSIVLVLGGHSLPLGICLALAILFISAVRRPGLMVFVVASALYLPLLGRYGLWDPWETHYGEVSREILSRDDWISLWWAQDRWFWSKPILIFWVEALIWSASGLNFRPDTDPLHTEWVLRLPIYLMSITALLAVYAVIARIWNKRAGLLAALALASMPYYAFLTHQAITDLPFVANMTTAMMLLVLGLTEDPERRSKSLKVGPWALSAQHAVIALILLVALPQLLYLASRNITLVPTGFAWHRDIFVYGSAGNPDVPGNFGLHDEAPRFNGIFVQPLAQALYWGLGLAAIVWMLKREQRLQQLYMFAFYGFCALAFMAKGIPGFALPGFVAMVFLLASGKFSMLFEGKLRVAAGMLVILVLGMPWFVAMYVRHGSGFTDRLIVHDHLNRLTSGVHGDNGSIQYFIWQLGYGLFPWVGLVPLALGTWLVAPARGPGDPLTRARRDLLYTMGLWFAVSFTLFSAMTTKFHHYIFPAVPPCAVLIGLLLDRFLPRTQGEITAKALLPTAAALLAPVPLVLGAAGLRGDVRGILPPDLSAAAREAWVFQNGWSTGGCIALIAAGIALFVVGVRGVLAIEAEPVVPVVPPEAIGGGVVRVGGVPASAAGEAAAEVAVARDTGDGIGGEGESSFTSPSTFTSTSTLTTETEATARRDARTAIAEDELLASESLTAVTHDDELAAAPLAASATAADEDDPPTVPPPAAVPCTASPAAVSGNALAALPELGALQGGAITVSAIVGTLLIAFVARDLSWNVGQPPGSERLIHLFVYNYTRPWPEHLDYRPILFGFGFVLGLFTLLIGLRKLRGAATLSLIGAALAFTVFILDVYMVDLSPHWSQRELVQRYYAERKGAQEPLLAYQMNWKGENYYTGNRVHVFVDLDNKKLLEWVDKNKGKTVFILLEHSRLDRLKRILPGRDVKALSNPRDNNKFVLVKTTL